MKLKKVTKKSSNSKKNSTSLIARRKSRTKQLKTLRKPTTNWPLKSKRYSKGENIFYASSSVENGDRKQGQNYKQTNSTVCRTAAE